MLKNEKVAVFGLQMDLRKGGVGGTFSKTYMLQRRGKGRKGEADHQWKEEEKGQQECREKENLTATAGKGNQETHANTGEEKRNGPNGLNPGRGRGGPLFGAWRITEKGASQTLRRRGETPSFPIQMAGVTAAVPFGWGGERKNVRNNPGCWGTYAKSVMLRKSAVTYEGKKRGRRCWGGT